MISAVNFRYGDILAECQVQLLYTQYHSFFWGGGSDSEKFCQNFPQWQYRQTQGSHVISKFSYALPTKELFTSLHCWMSCKLLTSLHCSMSCTLFRNTSLHCSTWALHDHRHVNHTTPAHQVGYNAMVTGKTQTHRSLLSCLPSSISFDYYCSRQPQETGSMTQTFPGMELCMPVWFGKACRAIHAF